MRFSMVEPGGFLRNYIDYYCFMETDRYDTDVVERVIPTENVQLMFHYKNPFVVHDGIERKLVQPRTILSGLSSSFADVSTHGEAGVVFVSFSVMKACHFLPFALSDIENSSIDMADAFGSEIYRIEEQLYLASGIKERTAVIDNFLLRRFSPIPDTDRFLIEKGASIIRSCGGRISAKVLADQLVITPKSLERRFIDYVGKTPKQFIKLIRFRKILTDLGDGACRNLTECAYRNGYFDQSHFIRDFKSFTGLSPKKFLAQYPSCDTSGYN